ncbi:MAG TPA: hypothetical protein VK906_08395 [Egicoccus sp.]|nr:hypothetical protein [Egicoccus sp.]HSK23180.1 hypothetical protein [Egicoccus sp.]
MTTTIRLAVPQFGSSSGGTPRVVVEERDPSLRRLAGDHLRRSGFEVASCGGPEQLSRRRCPLEEGGRCPAIVDADVVVSSLRSDTPRHVAVVGALRRRYPGTPLLIVAPPLIAHRHRRLLEGCHVVPRYGRSELARAIDSLLVG